MPAATYVQDAFDAGEWSKYAQGRVTDPKYRSALALCRNMLPTNTNALVRRPGFQFAGTTRGGAPGRLLSFSFEDNLPYMMEFTDGHLRFFQGANLVTEGSPSSITAISTATPAVVNATYPSTWATGDNVAFNFQDQQAQINVPYLANRVFTITIVDSTHFSLADAITGASVNGTTLAWTTSNITVDRVVDIGTVWSNGDWANLRPVQNEETMLLLTPDERPQAVVATPPAAGSGSPASFSIADAKFVDGPYLDPFPDIIATPDAISGTISFILTAQTYSSATIYSDGDYVTSSGVTYISLRDTNVGNTPSSSPTWWQVASAGDVVGPGGFQTTDIGRHVRMFSEPPLWGSSTDYVAGNVVKYADEYWVALVSITHSTPTTGNISLVQPGIDATKWAPVPSACRWTWGKIVSLVTTNNLNPSLGTPIGNATSEAALSAAFDGNTNKGSSNSVGLLQSVNTIDGYVGLSFSAGQVISSVAVYPTNDHGFGDFANNNQLHSYSPLRLNLFASNTLPTTPSNGTLLGTIDISNSFSARSPITILSNSGATTYKFMWVEFTNPTSTGAYSRRICAAQLVFGGSAAIPQGSGVNVEILGDPLLYTTAMTTWQLGLYTDTGPVYPTCGCYSDGRLWLSGAVANRFDATTSNGFGEELTFTPTDEDGTVSDDNGISYTFDSSDLNSIYWMEPDAQGIICGTIGGEWLIDAPDANSGGFAPDNIRARRVTKYGCANVEPRRTGLTTVFVQRYKQKLLEYVADAFSGRLSAPNLSEKALHLTQTGIEELAYQQEINPIVWCRGSDGSLFGVTYKRTSLLTSQPAELIGWHKHPLGSGRLVESVCIGPSVDGTLEALTVVTNDPSTGIRHVEVLRNVFEENDNVMTSWHMDDAIVPTCAVASGTTGLILKGLSPMDGKLVTAFVAGLNVGQYQVVDGKITVLFGNSFTSRWLTQLAAAEQDFGDMGAPMDNGNTIPALVGYTYQSQGQLLRPNAPEVAGTRIGPAFGKYKRSQKFAVLLNNTQDVQFGTDFSDMHQANLRSEGGGQDIDPPQLYAGTFWDTLVDDVTLDSEIAWLMEGPFPAAIMAIGGFLETAE